MLNRLIFAAVIAVGIMCACALSVSASEEEYMGWKQVRIVTHQYKEEGTVIFDAETDGEAFKAVSISAFGKQFKLEDAMLSKLKGFILSTLSVTHEGGYEQLGGPAVHFKMKRVRYVAEKLLEEQIAISISKGKGLAISVPWTKAPGDPNTPATRPAATILRPWDCPVGSLGFPLGSYLTVEGRREGGRDVGSKGAFGTLVVDTINGKRLDKPIAIWVDHAVLPPPPLRCILKGYEDARMIGLPPAVEQAAKEAGKDIGQPQAGWQMQLYFVALSDVALKDAALKSDPVAAIRSALPKDWTILKVEENAYPPGRPEGKGKAVFLGHQGSHASAKEGVVVTIMPADYKDGEYKGAAKVPQTLRGPYFPTFIDAPATDDWKKHFQVHFSYGSGLDPELKKAILEAIPGKPPAGETKAAPNTRINGGPAAPSGRTQGETVEATRLQTSTSPMRLLASGVSFPGKDSSARPEDSSGGREIIIGQVTYFDCFWPDEGLVAQNKAAGTRRVFGMFDLAVAAGWYKRQGNNYPPQSIRGLWCEGGRLWMGSNGVGVLVFDTQAGTWSRHDMKEAPVVGHHVDVCFADADFVFAGYGYHRKVPDAVTSLHVFSTRHERWLEITAIPSKDALRLGSSDGLLVQLSWDHRQFAKQAYVPISGALGRPGEVYRRPDGSYVFRYGWKDRESSWTELLVHPSDLLAAFDRAGAPASRRNRKAG